jgi:plastocyanin
MTWRLLICFSALSVFAGLVRAGSLAGRVELTGTRVKDRSGVVVWLEPASPTPAAPRATAHVNMTQKNKTFLPHILAIQAGTTVDFPNADPIFHNAFSSFDGKVFDVGLYPPGTSRSVYFDRAGVVRVFCNIHSAMSAVIVVLKQPWFAVSSRDGSFQISGVPEGDYFLHVYHERATDSTLNALTHPISVKQNHSELPVILISETGYLPAPHKNKFGKDYPPTNVYSEHLR